MIHRQETLSLLGIPCRRFIDIEDSEQILRAIRMTPADMPIDLVLHTPGGLVLASDQIAYALKRHPGSVTVIVPHYAMSGGTLVALAADEILMDPDAVLGPVDPQLGNPLRGAWPAASILAALEQPNPNRDDETLILGDIARKAIVQVRETVVDLVRDRMPAEAETLATTLTEGRWTHDSPIRREQAGELGLPGLFPADRVVVRPAPFAQRCGQGLGLSRHPVADQIHHGLAHLDYGLAGDVAEDQRLVVAVGVRLLQGGEDRGGGPGAAQRVAELRVDRAQHRVGVHEDLVRGESHQRAARHGVVRHDHRHAPRMSLERVGDLI